MRAMARKASAAGAAGLRRYTALVMGAPGGGKGTISKYLVRDFCFSHLSTGDLLREQVAQGTGLGKEAAKHMNAGGLVPDELMVDLVCTEVDQRKAELLLLDGFPRTVPQAEALGSQLEINTALNLDIPQEVIVERISQRRVHPASGRTYAYDFNPPRVKGLDDETGEPLVQRDDDKPETVRARLETYAANTAPLIEYYDAAGVLASFSGTESKVIYVDLKAYVEKQLSAAVADTAYQP
mmetsp:Transcript_26988/g.84865  ORF Transcript_26988/g.84865 Transcript_26988/m.84865 type:complete len:239 (-) Transcript_26988:1415-2131(-)